MTPSQAKANTKPLLSVVVNEIMYSPVDPNEEYIELYNPTAQSVALTTQTSLGVWMEQWTTTSRPSASIAAGGRIVVVGFDPQTEPARVTDFAAAYGGQFTANVNLFGPWQGILSNEGERVALEKPQLGTTLPADLGWVILDEVIYSPVAPWPAGTDATGDACRGSTPTKPTAATTPTNWQSAVPTTRPEAVAGLSVRPAKSDRPVKHEFKSQIRGCSYGFAACANANIPDYAIAQDDGWLSCANGMLVNSPFSGDLVLQGPQLILGHYTGIAMRSRRNRASGSSSR